MTLFARFLGLPTSLPLHTAMWYARSCSGIVVRSGSKHSMVSGTSMQMSARMTGLLYRNSDACFCVETPPHAVPYAVRLLVDFLEHIVVESVLSGFSEACGDCLYLMVALVIVPEYRNLSESNL